jgi:hypothetical protein
MTKVGLYAIGTSTTLESNKSHSLTPKISRLLPGSEQSNVLKLEHRDVAVAPRYNGGFGRFL